MALRICLHMGGYPTVKKEYLGVESSRQGKDLLLGGQKWREKGTLRGIFKQG